MDGVLMLWNGREPAWRAGGDADVRLWNAAGHPETFRREREVLAELVERAREASERPSPDTRTGP